MNYTSVDPKQFVWSRSKSRQSCGHNTHKGLETVGDKWEASVKSCGQSTYMRLETMVNK